MGEAVLDRPAADYVLFYAKLCTFPEDASCAVKHACRRAFSQMAAARGLKVAKVSAELPAAPTAGGRKSRRAKGSMAPYKTFYWSVRASTTALLREAEYTGLELRLRDARAPAAEETGDPEPESITAPFIYEKMHAFHGCHAEGGAGEADATPALTGAQRIYLTHSILHRIDISQELQRLLATQKEDGTFCAMDCIFCSSLRERIAEGAPIVLEHLLKAKIFADAFAVHERAAPEHSLEATVCCSSRVEDSVTPDAPNSLELKGSPRPPPQPATDVRQQLQRTWGGCCDSDQSLSLIRLYFGEKLAFYYAWLGHTIASLHFLTAIGLACLVYGLVNASLYHKSEAAKLISQLANATIIPADGNAFAISLVELMQFIRLMFENQLTIPFGCVLTAWHLATAEGWRSSEAALSDRWGVKRQDLAERPRPAFTPAARAADAGHCKLAPQFHRCLGPLTCLVFCAAIAIAVAVSIEVSKLVAANRHCGSQPGCILLSVILPIGGHVVVMTLLDWGYSHLAKKMTDWENHQFQSDHDSAYAIKAFAFRFANNFASMIYSAFVRQQQVTFGDFTDRCVQNQLNVDCFNMLSVYAAGYIIGKSLLKLLVDFARHHASQRKCPSGCLPAPLLRLLCSCGASLRHAAYAMETDILAALEREAAAKGGGPVLTQLARERDLPREKTQGEQLDEYLEKMTLHGYLVMFGSACYIAPLAVLIALLVDLKLDASRLTRTHRRPVPLPAQSVGVWNQVHGFLGHAGVLSTAGVLGFTSDSLRVHGLESSVTNRLVLFIVFSGAMYLFKYLIAAFYSGRSDKLKRRLNWEYQNVQKLLETGSVTQDALDSLSRTVSGDRSVSGDRWCHALFPCFASPSSPPRPGSAELHQLV